MRNIEYIAVHSTATLQEVKVSVIQNYWKNTLRWKMPGYHFIVEPNGHIIQLLDIEKVSNGVKGWNSKTINIAYIGGISLLNIPVDNRTDEQKKALLKKLKELKKQFPKAKIQGHRDFPNVKKACPCFDAKKEYENI